MIENVFEYLGNPSLVSWSVLAKRSCNSNNSQNFVSAFVNINVCPPLFLAKCSQNRQTKIEFDPPPQFRDIAHHEHDFELFDWHVGTWSQAHGGFALYNAQVYQ